MAAGRERDPDAGDLVWVDFGPPVGHEQAGTRPAVVISPRRYNAGSSVLLVCPITKSPRPWPFKIALGTKEGITGFVLTDQVQAVDPAERVIKRAGRVPDETLSRVRGALIALIGGKA
jgi:mRNA interferase MazF